MQYNVYIYIYIIMYLIRLGIYHDTKRVSPWQDTISQPSRSSRPVAASGRIIGCCDGCSMVLHGAPSRGMTREWTWGILLNHVRYWLSLSLSIPMQDDTLMLLELTMTSIPWPPLTKGAMPLLRSAPTWRIKGARLESVTDKHDSKWVWKLQQQRF